MLVAVVFVATVPLNEPNAQVTVWVKLEEARFMVMVGFPSMNALVAEIVLAAGSTARLYVYVPERLEPEPE